MNSTMKTKVLVEGALLIAVATVLSYIKLIHMPQGGSITLEMIPLIMMGLRNGLKPGMFTCFVYGLLQMLLDISNVLYCTTLLAQIGCILLDYVIAYFALGVAGAFSRPEAKNRLGGFITGSILACFLRFICSFLSGWLIWGGYAPEGTPVWIYSLGYNGAYMLPETIIVVVIITLLYKTSPSLFKRVS